MTAVSSIPSSVEDITSAWLASALGAGDVSAGHLDCDGTFEFLIPSPIDNAEGSLPQALLNQIPSYPLADGQGSVLGDSQLIGEHRGNDQRPNLLRSSGIHARIVNAASMARKVSANCDALTSSYSLVCSFI